MERLGHHRIREAKMARPVRAVDDDGDGRSLVEGGRDVDVVAPECFEHVEREVPAEHRCKLEDALAGFGQLAQPPEHGLTYVARDEQAIGVEGVVEPSFGREQPRGLPDIEGIAVCQLADLRDQPLRRPDAGRAADDLRDTVRVQAAEAQTGRVPLADELREHIREPAPHRVGIAIGRDHQQPHPIELPGEELQEQKRGRIRDVHVVEHCDERGVDGREATQADDRFVEAEARRVGSKSCVRSFGGQHRHDLGEVVGRRAQALAQLGRADAIDERREHLGPRPVGRRTARLPATAPTDLRARRSSPIGQLRGETRLADARVTGDEEETPAARPCVAESSVERRVLCLPSHEGIGPHAGESGSARQRRHEVLRAGPQGRDGGSGGERLEVADRSVDLHASGGSGAGDASVRTDDAEGLLELGTLDRPPEQIAELAARRGAVRQGHEHRECVDALEQVVAGRLAELGLARREIEDVVDDLECGAESQAVARRCVDERPVVTGDQRADAGGRGEECRRLAFDRRVVVVLRAVDVERALQLTDLALAEPSDRRGEEARDLGAESCRDLDAFASR